MASNFIPNTYHRYFNYSSGFFGPQTELQIQAAPSTTGEAIYVTDVIFAVAGVASSLRLTEGITGETVNLANIAVAVNSQVMMNFTVPFKLTANSSLALTSVTPIEQHSVTVHGYIST